MSYATRHGSLRRYETLTSEEMERAAADIYFEPKVTLDARDVAFLCGIAKEYLKQDGPNTILGRVQRKAKSALERECRKIVRLRMRAS
jgi:hypothetical protein